MKGGDIVLPLHGYEVQCLDFELSKLGVTDSRVLFRDVKVFVTKLLNLVEYVDVVPIQRMYDLLNGWIDTDRDSRMLLELLPICDQIEGKRGQKAGGAANKKRAVYYGKKIV